MSQLLEKYDDAITVLQAEFAKARKKNPQYSLRAFARRGAISAGLLSDILNRRRNLTPMMATKLARRLQMDDASKECFVQAATLKSRHSPKGRSRSGKIISEDSFKIISDWYHLAIISLVKVYPKITIKESATKLGIAYFSCKEGFNRLESLGIIENINKKWNVISDVITGDNLPSEAIRSFHSQMLDKAKEKIDAKGFKKTNYSTMVMSIDKRKLPAAIEKIKVFRRELSAFLEDGTPEETYALSIALFNLEENN